jgi:hypothetical protein
MRSAAPKPLKNLATGFNDGPFVFERVAVDRATENVYWNGNNKISDWRNPVPRKTPMNIDNVTISPKGFVYGWALSQSADVPIARYTSDSLHRPAPYGNTGGNYATGGIHYEWGFAGTPGNHRGMAVGWQGQIAAFAESSPLFQVADTGGGAVIDGPNSSGPSRALMSITGYNGGKLPEDTWTLGRQMMGCVKYDPAGNFYVGIKKVPPKPVFPSGMGTDPAFRNSGCVVKFNKDSAGSMDQVGANFRGYDKMYPQMFGPFTAAATGGTLPGTGLTNSCTCRNNYFDVDPYGRLYIPNGVFCQVSVVDNAGNTISAFGQYGNTDARGGLSGPGQTVSTPAIPLAWPASVAASEDYLYIGDLVNERLARVQMVYAIDNIPGFTEHKTALEKERTWRKFTLTAVPNPFYPESRINVSLPIATDVSLKVYNVSGRLVRTLASGKYNTGSHLFVWNAKDDAGGKVAPGLYLYKLTAGKQALMERTILAK